MQSSHTTIDLSFQLISKLKTERKKKGGGVTIYKRGRTDKLERLQSDLVTAPNIYNASQTG